MNRIFVVLLLVLISTGIITCQNKNTGEMQKGKPAHFTVEGKLNNGAGHKLYLRKFESDGYTSIDSTDLDETGEFSFKATVTHPEFFVLRIEDGTYINLLLYGKEKVKIVADYNNLSDYTLEGSEDSKKIRELSIQTTAVISEIDKLNRMSRDSVNSANYTRLMIQGNEKYQNMMSDLKDYSLKFIDENSNSLISLFALYGQVGPRMMVFNPLTDIKVFEKTDSILNSLYPEHQLVLNLHEYVSVLKAQIASQNESLKGLLDIGQDVPEISLNSPEGKPIKLSSLKGKIVLLDFWASWCQPCRHENPNLVENYRKYHSLGFEIYQVSLDRNREEWLNGIKQDHLDWVHVSDLKYWESSVVSMFNIRGIPMNYLLDREGKVIARNLRGPELGEKLTEVFNR